MRTPSNDSHPFFCRKANCRKSAWATPNYLTPQDWQFARRIVAILKGRNRAALCVALFESYATTEAFFNRVIGWPEGLTYSWHNDGFVSKTVWPGLKRHTLAKLAKAVRDAKQ